MTVSASPRRASYAGDGSTVTFTVPFKFLADTSLKVILTAADGSETDAVPSSVAGAGAANGGSVTLATAPAIGVTVTVVGSSPLEQQTDLAISDGMPADVIETAVDLLTIQNQEQADQIGLAIKLPVSYSGDELQFPAPVPNEVPYYDENGKLVMSSVGFSTLMGTIQNLITLAAEAGTAHTHKIVNLTDVDLTGISDKQILQYDSGSQKIKPGSFSGEDIIARKSLSLIQFNQMAVNNYTLQNKDDGITDVFADESGVDGATSANVTYSAANDYYENAGSVGTDAIPTMTSNTAPSGTASASSIDSGAHPAWHAFDKSLSTFWLSASGGVPGRIEYDFGVTTNIGGYTITGPATAQASRAPKDFKLQGWNGSSWVDLDTQTGQTGWSNKEKRSFALGSTASFDKYGVYITALNGDVYIDIWEVEFLAAGVAANMTLQSEVFTADTAPTSADLFIWQENVDAATLNTDLKAYVSRDDGTTWTQGTLVEEFSAPVGRILSALDVDISAQPSGTSVKWKIETLNTKSQRIRGVDLQWS